MTFGTFLDDRAKGDVLLSMQLFTISSSKGEQRSLPTKPSPGSFPKAKLLREYVTRLLQLPLEFNDVPFPRRFLKIIQPQEREARMPSGDHDSDDEQIPDPAIRPPFTSVELHIAQYLYDCLCEAYLVGRGVGFSNAAMVVTIMKFLQRVSTVSPFKCLHTTSTWCDQPGAMCLKWQSVRDKGLRSPPEHVIDTRDRYPDCIVYDMVNRLSIIVVEIKKNEDDPSRVLNNEQLVGLWGNQQQAMLGLEVTGITVRPKVLLLNNTTMHLYYLQDLDMTDTQGLYTLASFVLALLTYVEYVVPANVPSTHRPNGQSHPVHTHPVM